MARTEAHRGPSYSGGSGTSGEGHRGPSSSYGGVGSPPSKERGGHKKKKKKVKFKKTLPRGGTQGYSSSYSDPLTKRKVVDLGSSM